MDDCVPLRGTWRCLGTSLVVTTLGGVATGISWVEARHAAMYPIKHRTGPRDKKLSVQNINRVTNEKPCPTSLCPTRGLANEGYLVLFVELEKKKWMCLGDGETMDQTLVSRRQGKNVD